MSILVPARPMIYHITHVDRLSSIIASGGLLPDSEMVDASEAGTMIGMPHIKARRRSMRLSSHPDLHVGECVPFYFCPRSIMLYVISRQSDPELPYHGGQNSIVHLEADLYDTVTWAKQAKRRWAFTTSNAGAFHFVDYADINQLNQINWSAVQATYWRDVREEKQAEFLLECGFPWGLVARIGCRSQDIQQQVQHLLMTADTQPPVQVLPGWYYPD